MRNGVRYVSMFARLLANSVEDERVVYRGLPCWCWTGRHRRHYGVINLRDGNRHVTRRVARVMTEIVLGRSIDSNEETIEHLCKMPPCINPWHLALIPMGENSRAARMRQYHGIETTFKPMLKDDEWWLPDALAPRSMPQRRVADLEAIPF